jgi:hypothetical protein
MPALIHVAEFHHRIGYRPIAAQANWELVHEVTVCTRARDLCPISLHWQVIRLDSKHVSKERNLLVFGGEKATILVFQDEIKTDQTIPDCEHLMRTAIPVVAFTDRVIKRFRTEVVNSPVVPKYKRLSMAGTDRLLGELRNASKLANLVE